MFSCEYCKFLEQLFIEHLPWLLHPSTATFRNYYWEGLAVILFTLTHPSKQLNASFKTDNMLHQKNTWKKS